MIQPKALHHIAISTGDIKKQIEFFSDVLGMELTALYWMHGAENAWHAFLKLGQASVAFVFVPGNEKVETRLGETHAGHAAGTSAPGTMQHLALSVDTQQELLALRDRIRSREVTVMGPIHHGFCSSIYFAGPENLTLEVSTSDEANHPLDHNGTWIDSEVVKLAGISPEELERFCKPDDYVAPAEPVAQPPLDDSKPRIGLPLEVLEPILGMPDEAVTEAASDTAPPAK